MNERGGHGEIWIGGGEKYELKRVASFLGGGGRRSWV